MPLDLTLDGETRHVHVDPAASLVDVLRNQLGALAPKVGCRTGDCGACTVLENKVPIKSCIALALDSQGADIETLTSLVSAEGELHPVQEAFWDAFGFQCGFCLSGMVMTAVDLLATNPTPTDADIRQTLSGNLCRCTGYETIVAAVSLAAARGAASGSSPDVCSSEP